MNSKVLFAEFVSFAAAHLERDEATASAYLVFEKILNVTRTDILAEKPIDVSAAQRQAMASAQHRLSLHEPVQYIVGEAYFFGRTFAVTPSVLIPRPETEELVAAVLQRLSSRRHSKFSVADIGTGSGCIAITLALEHAALKVLSTDVSREALAVAQSNARALGAHVQFVQHNILEEQFRWSGLDIIVSNPPYIARGEGAAMQPNVTGHEPHLALFVADENPLVFYKAIAGVAGMALRSGGFVALEINERFGKEVADVCAAAGLVNVQLLRDTSGKDRMVFADKP